MVFYAAFNSILVISRRHFTLLMSFLGFTSTRLGSEVSCPRFSAARTQDPWITSQTLYHWATWDPFSLSVTQFVNKLSYSPFNPLPHMPIMGFSNSAANENMMSKIWTNGVQLSDSIENIVGKEEIARHEQFLLFPQFFQKLSVVYASKWVFMEKRV